jgi:hypothetical protein
MSISTYFRPNIHQNGPEILGVKRLLHLEEKGQSPKKCSDVIGGNKWYLVFEYTSKNKWAWALVFFSG